MGYISTLGMSREKWLLERKKGVGGSEVAAVLGFSKWATPLTIYMDKVNPETNEITNPHMEAGIRIEPVIAKWWAEKHGFTIQEDNKIRYLDEKPWVRCNIDRLIQSSNGRGSGTLECKNTTSFAFKYWQEDGIPLYVLSQIIWNMHICKHTWGAVVVLVDGWDLQAIDVSPDPALFEMMVDRVDRFWKSNVQKRIAPDPITIEEVKRLYPTSAPGKSLLATPETMDLVIKAKALELERKALEEKEKTLKGQIQGIMKDAEFLEGEGGDIVATFKQDKPSIRFDVNAFKSSHPGIYSKFEFERAGSRRFVIKKAV